MKTRGICFIIALMATVSITSCQNTTEKKQTAPIAAASPSVSDHSSPAVYQIGDRVPNDLVCMVNDDYMGKKQMEVPFEGKTYYGCCKMCVERIPNDPAVRTSIDPLTKAPVDKATAYIVLLNEKGNVAYFENEQNYQKLIEEQ